LSYGCGKKGEKGTWGRWKVKRGRGIRERDTGEGYGRGIGETEYGI
jgi:hypothetical protein